MKQPGRGPSTKQTFDSSNELLVIYKKPTYTLTHASVLGTTSSSGSDLYQRALVRWELYDHQFS